MTTPNLPHEGRFLQALGIHPATVMAGTTRLEWEDGKCVLRYTAALVIEPAALSVAFMAASHAEVQTGPTDAPKEEGEAGEDT